MSARSQILSETVYSCTRCLPIDGFAEVDVMSAPRAGVSKSVLRRPVARRFAKRKAQVIAFETWQRYPEALAIGRRTAAVAKR